MVPRDMVPRKRSSAVGSRSTRDGEIDNWSSQFEPLCRTKQDCTCIKLVKIFVYGPKDSAKILSRIIINHGRFPEVCQEMFLQRKYKYVNKGTSKAKRRRGAHQDAEPKYHAFKAHLDGIESRYKYGIFADGEPALTDAHVNDRSVPKNRPDADLSFTERAW